MQFKGQLCLLLAACFMSTNGVFVKLLSPALPIPQIVALRFILSFITFSVLVFFLGKKISTSDLRSELLLGVFAGAIIICYFTAIASVGVSLSVVLLYTAPFFATILSHFLLDEKIAGKHLIALVTSFVGIVFIIRPSFSTDPLMVVGVLAGFFFGVKMVFNRRLGLHDSAWTMTFYALLVPSVVSLLYLSSNVSAFVLPQGMQILLILGLVFIPTVTGFLLEHTGFKKVPVSEGSVILMFEVVVASTWGILLFSETMDALTILGGVLVLSSGAYLNLLMKSGM